VLYTLLREPGRGRRSLTLTLSVPIMDPSPIPIVTHAPSTQDVPMIKTEERPRVRRPNCVFLKEKNRLQYVTHLYTTQPIPAQGQHPPQRVQRYKDKCVPAPTRISSTWAPHLTRQHRFQTLRERYESVTSVRYAYQPCLFFSLTRRRPTDALRVHPRRPARDRKRTTSSSRDQVRPPSSTCFPHIC